MWDNQPLESVMLDKADPIMDVAFFNVRLLEAETSREHGMSFDEAWYALPLLTREMMVAARIGRQWLSSLQAEDAAKRSRR